MAVFDFITKYMVEIICFSALFMAIGLTIVTRRAQKRAIPVHLKAISARPSYQSDSGTQHYRVTFKVLTGAYKGETYEGWGSETLVDQELDGYLDPATEEIWQKGKFRSAYKVFGIMAAVTSLTIYPFFKYAVLNW